MQRDVEDRLATEMFDQIDAGVAQRQAAVADRIVLTKTDLYGEWRRIVEINEGHLRRAGLNVPIVAVSSFLRMRAQARDSTQLNDESGFPRLVDLLRRDVLGAAAATKVAAARAELAFVVAQLRERVDAERAVAAVERLRADIGIPGRLRDLGATEAQLPGFAAKAFAIRRILRVNPRPATVEDCEAILRSSW